MPRDMLLQKEGIFDSRFAMENSILDKENPLPQIDGVDVNRPIGLALESFASPPGRIQLQVKDLTLDTATVKFLLAQHNHDGSLQFVTQPGSSLQEANVNPQGVDLQITTLGNDSDLHSVVSQSSVAAIQNGIEIYQSFQNGEKISVPEADEKEPIKSHFADEEQRMKFISRKLKNIKSNIDELYKKAGITAVALSAYNGNIQFSGPDHMSILEKNNVFNGIFWNVVASHESALSTSSKDHGKTIVEKDKTSLLPWQCDECSCCFATQHYLVNHKLLSHSGLPVHKCEFCDKEFVDITILQKHLTTHTEENSFPCKICGNSFAGKNLLNSHMKIHNDMKPFTCKICAKSFNSASSLQYHVSKHTGDKKCVCIHCNKEFTKMSSLTVHMRIHSGEQPYRCQECGKGFAVSTHLTRHLRVHSGERPYLCEVCGKRFNRSSHLRIHFRIHSGEKPYECEICGKRFNQTVTRKKHLKTHAK